MRASGTDLLPADAAAVLLPRYGASRARLRLVSRRSDRMLRLRLSQRGAAGQKVLCVYPSGTQRRDIESELAWLSAVVPERASATGLRVPQPLPANDGSIIQRIDADGRIESRYAVVLCWPAGRCFDRGLTPARLTQLGAALGTLHNLSHELAQEGRFRTSRLASPGDPGQWADLAPSYANGLSALDVSRLVDALERMRGGLLELRHASEGWGVIHANLHAANVLFSHEHTGIVDFDSCGWGYYGCDLAAVLLDLKYPWFGNKDHRDGYAQLQAALLQGYQTQRALPPDFERALPLLMRARMLAVIHSVLLQWPAPTTYPWGLPFVHKAMMWL